MIPTAAVDGHRTLAELVEVAIGGGPPPALIEHVVAIMLGVLTVGVLR